MTDALWVVVAVAVAGSVTFRLSFLALIDRVESIPPTVEELFRLVPPAVLAALVVPAVLQTDGGISVGSDKALAAAIAAVVAWRTENLLLTVAVGMGALWALTWLG